MSGKIPQQFIDDLLTRVDVIDVINRRVPLKKAGPEYKACCPFHDEKTPSFTVSPSKQFYHCFGCGAHGTAIGFLMEYDRLEFPEAIEELAASIGLEVPREGGYNNQPSQRPLYEILEQVASWFNQQLRQHPDAPKAVQYLTDRGLSGEIAKTYRIGFAPPGWDNLLSQFGKTSDENKLLSEAGLLSEPDGKRYDRFRDRIMFPITDTRGRVIGFGGRVLDDSMPKYLNSPETPVFHKGNELYGLYEAKHANKKLDQLLVVEGYMDVIALAQFDIKNAVATLGTAVTDKNMENMFRAAPEIIFCFDGDRAGQDAAWKALNTALPLLKDGRQARFLLLSEGDDPDTLVRRIGTQALLQQMSQALPLSEFLFSKLTEQVDMTTLDGRARLAFIARPHLNLIPNGMFRKMMEAQLAKITGSTTMPQQATSRPRKQQYQKNQPGILSPMHRAIALILQYPPLGQLEDLPQEWKKLQSSGSQILENILELLAKAPNLTTAALVEHWQDEKVRQHLSKLACTEMELFDNTEEQFCGALKNLGQQARKTSAGELSNKLRPSDLSEEEKQKLRALYSHKKQPPS